LARPRRNPLRKIQAFKMVAQKDVNEVILPNFQKL
jgi:hypothetical protein